MVTSFCQLPKSKSFLNLSGQVYGKLQVLGFAGTVGGGRSWHCLCECGTHTITRGDHMRSGRTISCGCVNNRLHQEKSLPPADVETQTLRYAWHAIQARCSRGTHRAYSDYGGRGIENRFTGFMQFCECLGRRPSKDHSVDRIDNNGHYEPGNVRWATRIEQGGNKRNNCVLEIDGTSRTIAEWSRVPGAAKEYVIRARARYGWTAKDAVFRPATERRRRA